MCRKVLGTALLVGLAGFWMLGRDALSYVTTSAGWLRSSVKSSVPMDFEIDRTRELVRDLTPDIRRSLEMIAKEEVDLERIARQISATETRLKQDQAKLLVLKDELASASGKAKITLAGRSYTPAQVQADLAARFQRFKDTEATLANLRQVQAAREQGLAAARQKVEGLVATKRDLEVEIEHLEARHQMVQAAEANGELQFDDSRLSRVKDQIAELHSRLQVAERMMSVAGEFAGEIPLEEPGASDIVEQVTRHFAEPSETDLAAHEPAETP